MAGIHAGLRVTKEPLTSQRLVFLGAGAAAIGTARLVRAAMSGQKEQPASIVMLDSKGLIFDGRADVDDDKRPFALGRSELEALGLLPSAGHDLDSVIRHVHPTILIGTTATGGAFTEPAIREMAAHVRTPIILPLSNPTAKSEAQPADILSWTAGRALVASGSPFDPVPLDGGSRVIGQANNVFIFPGVGLGAIVSEAREVTESMFLVAARTLAGMVSEERLAEGALYPRLGSLRDVSRAIAVAVAKEARDAGVGMEFGDDDIDAAVTAAMWVPRYGF
jgi:malate dehydrogenase (oxaloacetate-decarboxylating)